MEASKSARSERVNKYLSALFRAIEKVVGPTEVPPRYQDVTPVLCDETSMKIFDSLDRKCIRYIDGDKKAMGEIKETGSYLLSRAKRMAS